MALYFTWSFAALSWPSMLSEITYLLKAAPLLEQEYVTTLYNVYVET